MTKPLDLVCLKDGQPVTTSLLIAQYFNKKHMHVLRDIEALLLAAPECKSNFGLSYQTVEMPKGGTRPQPFYEITRDGFTRERRKAPSFRSGI